MVSDLQEIHGMIAEMKNATEELKREKDDDRHLWNKRKEKSRKSADFSSHDKSFLSSLGPMTPEKNVAEHRIISETVSSLKPNKKYESKCIIKSRMVPVNFSSTISIKIGTTRKKFLEEITFQKRFVPVRYSEGIETIKCFASHLEIQCRPTEETVIQLKQPFIYQDLILPLDKRSPVFI